MTASAVFIIFSIGSYRLSNHAGSRKKKSGSGGYSLFGKTSMPILYDGIQIGTRRVDFFVEEKVMVELKAISELDDSHLSQAINYLEAFDMEVGLLINFGSRYLGLKRVVNTVRPISSMKSAPSA